MSNDNNGLFSGQPSILVDGTLSYTPAANANGSATVTVSLSDNGGTANGGFDTSGPQTFTISVDAVNDQPNFTAGDPPVVSKDAGAQVVPVGQATDARPYQLAGGLTERSVAAVYVVSHHCVDYGQIALPAFVEICHERGVPVIVDAASEYDLRGFLAAGADLVVYSAHKFLGGPTAGLVAGRKELVRAAYLQNHGIGRGMKVGKEEIIG